MENQSVSLNKSVSVPPANSSQHPLHSPHCGPVMEGEGITTDIRQFEVLSCWFFWLGGADKPQLILIRIVFFFSMCPILILGKKNLTISPPHTVHAFTSSLGRLTRHSKEDEGGIAFTIDYSTCGLVGPHCWVSLSFSGPNRQGRLVCPIYFANSSENSVAHLINGE